DKFGNTNRFLYDARGNLIQTMYRDGNFSRTVYDDNGRAVLATDRNQNTATRNEYDAVGRVTNVIRLLNARIDIVPDSDYPGMVRSVIGALGTPFSTNSTEFYPGGLVKARTGPDRRTTTYVYWPDGKLMTVTDPLTNRTF